MTETELRAQGPGDATAVSDEDIAWTFTELEAEVARLAPGCADGVRAALDSGPRFTAVLLACLRAKGRLATLLPGDVTSREAGHYLGLAPTGRLIVSAERLGQRYREAGAKDTFTFDETPSCAPTADSAHTPSDVAILQFTSGTTGYPKGVLLTEANLRANFAQSGEFLEGFRGQPVFCALPQFHATGLAVTLEHLCFASPVHFANRFDPASHLKRMNEHRCVGLIAGPDYLRLLLQLGLVRPAHLPHLTDIEIGTAAVSSELLRDLRANLPGVRIHIRYGLTEAFGALTRRSIDGGDELPPKGDVGRALPGVELRTVAGELQARAGTCTRQSLDRAGAPLDHLDVEGFLATGDLAELRGAVVQLLGRRSTFIKTHGHRVDPEEVADLLREVPGVGDAAVLGAPDPISGQKVVAFVEPAPGHTLPEPTDLRATCDRGLSPFKRPSRFVALDTMPRTRAGNPDLTALLQLLD